MSSLSWNHIKHTNQGFKLNITPFQLIDNQWLSIIGPSGAGKSTFLHYLFNLETQNHETVLVNGQCVKAAPKEERRMGFVLQKPILFPNHTVKENLFLAHKGTKTDDELLQHYFPSLGLTDDKIKQQASTLSGGEASRIQILQALIIPNVQVLLLDEAFASLDEPLKQELHFFIKMQVKKLSIPVVSVTHSQEDALQFSDFTLFLKSGNSLEINKTQDLFFNPQNLETAKFLSTGSIIKINENNFFLEPKNIFFSKQSENSIEVPINTESVFKHNDISILKTPLGIIKSLDKGKFMGKVYVNQKDLKCSLST